MTDMSNLFFCFFFFFSENIRLEISCGPSAKRTIQRRSIWNTEPYFPWKVNYLTIHMKCKALFSLKCKKEMCRAMRKCVLGHMWTAKAQIRLRIRAVWSGPSLSANRIIVYYRTYEWTAKTREILCAGSSESAHFVHTRRHFFAWCGQNKSVVYYNFA